MRKGPQEEQEGQVLKGLKELKDHKEAQGERDLPVLAGIQDIQVLKGPQEEQEGQVLKGLKED